MEHLFLCGDSADIVFTHSSGSSTIVEIETTTPFPGAHQAIKYRALLCAQKGLSLDTKNISTMLVAWTIPADVRDFCGKYGILWREYELAN
jgi:RecB family endonuclease NucS